MNVVAHQDDDLLFINPDISGDIADGRCVVTVFATAGDAGRSSIYWRGREAGAMAAYATMAGVPNLWTAGTVTVEGHTLTTMSLDGARIRLVFMRLPDGHGYAVTGYETLHRLWAGTLPVIHAVDSSASYTRSSLTATLTALMDTYRPGVIRTLNYRGPYQDGDHGDHHSAAYFTYAAHQDFHAAHRIHAYLGYQISRLPANLGDDTGDLKLRSFLSYGAHDAHVCRTRSTCLTDSYARYFSRRYVVESDPGGGPAPAAAHPAAPAGADHPAASG
jgi:LmbE family N-acetylglucosaminyl deacetylase